MKPKMVTVNALFRKHLENDNKMHFPWCPAVLGTSKLRLRTVTINCDMAQHSVATAVTMPTPTICTVMLQELTQHHCTSQQWHLQQRIASALSDISSSGTSASDLMSEVSDLASLMSMDTPDIDISSDISIHSDNPLPTSDSDTDSLFSISDFEVEYYMNWERRYRELMDKISTTHVLNPALPIPKSSQLHLLDHWRIHNPECFRRKLRVKPQTFDSLVSHIEDHPIFHNSQLPVYIQLYIFLFCARHYGNASSPEDTAQWAGVSVGGVEKCTDCVIVTFLSCHDEAIHLPDATEKDSLKSYVGRAVCPEWCGGFLLVGGSKFPFYQCPGLHGDALFDKDGMYSIDSSCQVHFYFLCNLSDTNKSITTVGYDTSWLDDCRLLSWTHW